MNKFNSSPFSNFWLKMVKKKKETQISLIEFRFDVVKNVIKIVKMTEQIYN